MQTIAQDYSPALSGRLAEDLLKAWLSGNAVSMRAELERSAAVSLDAFDTGEQERRDLLKAVAGRMMQCPDLHAVEGPPEVELCVRLLKLMIPV